MPFIENDNLVKLYEEIDLLSNREKDLKKGYIDLKLENNKIAKQKKTYIYLSLVLMLLLSASSLFFLTQFNKKPKSEFQNGNLQKTIDSISVKKNKKKNITNNKVIYAVQIGVFKQLNINNSNNLNKSFKKIINQNQTYTYNIGEFDNYNQAKSFKEQVLKLGIKDAFIVAYKEGKRMSIERALAISKNTND
ncbi:MAG: hypothetical protein ACK5H1_00455 [Tenacibaculum sp.]